MLTTNYCSLYRDIKQDKIVKPTRCSNCNKICQPIGHQVDQDNPLNVVWLCRSCLVNLRTKPILERFFDKVRFLDNGCWEWTASKKSNGYGQISVNLKPVLVHRFLYELSVGKIPEGLELDHLCRNRACVNPSHLEPVTRHENIMRGLGPDTTREYYSNYRKEHLYCTNGHLLDESNIYVKPTGNHKRECRICRHEQRVRYYCSHKK